MTHALRASLLTAVATLAAAVAWPRAAAADPPPPTSDIQKRVETHLQRGVEFYAEKQYELAIVEFRAGYGLDPRPELLFALAQAERLSGDCPTAVVYYQRFLDTHPDTNQAEAARVNMRRCKRALESGVDGRPDATADAELAEAERASAPPPAPTPAPSPQPMTVTLDDRATGGSGWYRDPIGGGLAASSAVGLGLGLGFWLAKSGAESDARAAADYTAHEDAMARARRDRTISLVATGVGVALAGAATYRYLTVSGKHDRTTVTVIPTASGGAIGVAGRF